MNENNTGSGLSSNRGGSNQNNTHSEERQEQQSYQPASEVFGADILSIVNSGFMSASAGSDACSKVAAGISEVYAKAKKSDFVKVTEIDNALLPGFKYSAVVISSLDGSTVNYFIILLGGTGRGSITANEYYKTVTAAVEVGGKEGDKILRDLYFPAHAFSDDFKEVIERKLAETYGGNYSYVSIEGIIIHEDAQFTDEFMRKAAGKAFNGNFAETKFKDGIGFGTVAGIAKLGNWRIQSNGCRNISSSISIGGNPVRSDFQLGLAQVSKSTLSNSIHSTTNDGPILTVGGFVDAIPLKRYINVNGIQQEAVRFAPQIVVTNVGTNFETTAMALLAISTAVVMGKKEMYLAALSPRGRYNVGGLNLIANLTNEAKGGQFLDFLSNQMSPAEIQDITLKMFSDANGEVPASVALDVEPYGPDAYMLAPFAQASNMALPRETRESALTNIVKTLSKMTDGEFKSNFPVDRIIASISYVPTGSYVVPGTSQLGDIRDFDMATVINVAGNNVEMITDWIATYNETNPFTAFARKVKVIAGIDSSAKITGEVRRIIFTGEFINALVTAIMKSGLNPQVNPEIDVKVANQFHINNYEKAGIGDTFGAYGMSGTGWTPNGFSTSSFGHRF